MTRRLLHAALCAACMLTTAAPLHAQSPRTRDIAPIIAIGHGIRFDAEGKPDAAAARAADRVAAVVEELLEPEIMALPISLAITGVACDELRLSSLPDAKRALGALRRIARAKPVLATTYAALRIDGLDARSIKRELSDGREAIERCFDAPPSEVLAPAGLVVPDAKRQRVLRGAGVEHVLSAYAAETADDTPRVVPAMTFASDATVDTVLAARPEAESVAVVVDDADELTALAEDARVSFKSVDAMRTIDERRGLIAQRVEAGRDVIEARGRATDAFDVLQSITVGSNRSVAIYKTVLARSKESATQGLPEDLAAAIDREFEKWSLSDGSVTFTSRRGSIPVTVGNRAGYAVRLRVTTSSPKVDFPAGRTRVVTIEPPGETITFDSVARSTGAFPVTVRLLTPDREVEFDTAELTVRSTAATVPGIVLTSGGALFLIVWFVRRLGQRRRKPS